MTEITRSDERATSTIKERTLSIRVTELEAENTALRRLLDEVALDRAGIAGQLSAAKRLAAAGATERTKE